MSLLVDERYLQLLQVEKLETRQSELLDLLPAMFAGDDFMNRFLCIFEDTFVPLQRLADDLHYYFNPLTAPSEMVDWLATWVNLTLDESWPLEQRRQLIRSASGLYALRGTKRGLVEYIRLYSGIEPDIAEYVDGMKLGDETFLGENTTIAGRERHSFTITLHLPGSNLDELAGKETTIRRIIESEKPAHTTYQLKLLTDEDVEKANKKRRKSAKDHAAMLKEMAKSEGEAATDGKAKPTLTKKPDDDKPEDKKKSDEPKPTTTKKPDDDKPENKKKSDEVDPKDTKPGDK